MAEQMAFDKRLAMYCDSAEPDRIKNVAEKQAIESKGELLKVQEA